MNLFKKSAIRDPAVKAFFKFLLRSEKKYFRIDQAVKDYQEKMRNFDPKLRKKISGHFTQLTNSGYTRKNRRSLYTNDEVFKQIVRKYLRGELELKYPGHLCNPDKLLEKARLELFDDSRYFSLSFLDINDPDSNFRKLLSEVENC